jgi:hypothetical protein
LFEPIGVRDRMTWILGARPHERFAAFKRVRETRDQPRRGLRRG